VETNVYAHLYTHVAVTTGNNAARYWAFGREPTDGVGSVVLPDSADGVTRLSWLEMRALAVKLLAEPQVTDADGMITTPVIANGE
jgi:hypothetical protein